jgi:hypothetical protein
MASSVNADNGVVSGTAGLKSSADNSGVLDLQTNGTTAISISASQVVTFANQPAYTGGTANGVLYLNASKVLTSGTALTFDGSQLDIPLGSAGTPSLSTPTDPNTGMFFPAADTIAFAEGGVEAMRLDSSGNLGLGVTPSAWFVLQKNIQIGGNFSGTPFAGALASQTNDAVTTLFNNAYVNSSNADTYYSSGSNEASKYRMFRSNHEWYSAPAGTAGNPITFTQVLGVTKDASLALQGATSQSGTGITFPATQSASSNANTLDDYEEGTFSVAISPSSGAFGSVTYNANNVSYYTKVGRLVSVTGIVWVSSYTTGTASGRMFFSLPFSAANVTQNFTSGAVMQFGGNGYTPSIATANVAARAEQGSALFSLGVDNNTVYTDEQIGTFSASGFLFRFNITYITT